MCKYDEHRCARAHALLYVYDTCCISVVGGVSNPRCRGTYLLHVPTLSSGGYRYVHVRLASTVESTNQKKSRIIQKIMQTPPRPTDTGCEGQDCHDDRSNPFSKPLQRRIFKNFRGFYLPFSFWIRCFPDHVCEVPYCQDIYDENYLGTLSHDKNPSRCQVWVRASPN